MWIGGMSGGAALRLGVEHGVELGVDHGAPPRV